MSSDSYTAIESPEVIFILLGDAFYIEIPLEDFDKAKSSSCLSRNFATFLSPEAPIKLEKNQSLGRSFHNLRRSAFLHPQIFRA